MEYRRRPWWLWAPAGLAGLAVIFLLVWKLPSLLYGDVSKASADARLQAASGFRTALVAGLAGLAALFSLAIAHRTYRLTQQGQITERYTKAIEQLGSDRLEIRLGGIYALERIAVDSERDHRTVVEVLGAFAREQRSQPAPPNNAKAGTDVEAAVTVLGRLPDRFGASRANLASVYAALIVLGRLPDPFGASRANLASAYLVGAGLWRANLRGAVLAGANLERADLRGAVLAGADLEEAILEEAMLEEANLEGAFLLRANLRGAILSKANLEGANLRGAILREAFLWRAILEEANLEGANLWGALLDGVRLGGAECNADTVWPDGFDWKAAGIILRED